MDYQNILDQVIKYLGPNLNKNLQIFLTLFSKSQILDAYLKKYSLSLMGP